MYPDGMDDSQSKTLRKQIFQEFGGDLGVIEEILPCTPFQRDVMAWTTRDPKNAVGHVLLEISNDADIERLTAAWMKVVYQVPALRTRTFISASGNHFQAVFSGPVPWKYVKSSDARKAIEDKKVVAVNEAQWNGFTVLEDPGGERRTLAWTFSNTIMDNSFQERVLEMVYTSYNGGKLQPSRGLKALAESLASSTEDAAQFWQQQFDGLNVATFPVLSSVQVVPKPEAQAQHRISHIGSAQQKWSSTVICRAALAALLCRYTHSQDVLFGAVTERPPVLDGKEQPFDGPTRTLVPVCVRCSPHMSVSNLMDAIAAHDTAAHEFEQTGLQPLRDAEDYGPAACAFQTVLAVTDYDATRASSTSLHRAIITPDRFVPYTNRALLIHCQMLDGSTSLSARYDSRIIDASQIGRFLIQLGTFIQRFCSLEVDELVRTVDTATAEDRTDIDKWNSSGLQIRELCIHDVITRISNDTPHKPAVFAWDGQWTYAELESLSSRLAGLILSLNLDLGQAVPLCFEKSKWTVVGMLAVLKAGGAFTVIDSSFPASRIAKICQQTRANVALASKIHCDTMRALVSHCFAIDDDLIEYTLGSEAHFKPEAKPSDLAYILFTSGSTGDPRGCMIEHRGWVSCALEFGPALGINKDSRAMQFASYAFGACLIETLTPLMLGGCVCIPSEDARMNDLPGFIKQANVNWAFFTPSFADTIEPNSVLGLRTLVLGGEPLSADVKDRWAPRLQLLHAYGQSESSSICSIAQLSRTTAEVNNIGRAIGARLWITDPDDVNQLAPIGSIGELIVESPGVARGYVNVPAQDETSFLTTAPAWYSGQQPIEPIKFYKTGDLVSYRSNGTIATLGRRDSQVKIRGQRVELGDVEAHLRQQMPDGIFAVVEAVNWPNRPNSTMLVAFLWGLCLNSVSPPFGTSTAEPFALDDDATNLIGTKLRDSLPQHFIPSYFIRTRNVPKTYTGKIDRRKLRELGAKLLKEKNRTVTWPTEDQFASTNDRVSALRQLWSRSLDLDINSINSDTNFFHLGGDSLAAIKMVNLARLSGLVINVSDIFQHPTILGLAASITHGSAVHVPIPQTEYSGPVLQSFAQSRLWFLNQLNLGSSWYLMPVATRLHGPLHTAALNTALQALEQRHESLRTTFEEQDGVGVQVVRPYVSQDLRVIDVSTSQEAEYSEALKAEQTKPFDLAAEPGWRTSLLRMGEDDHVLSIVMHHIISDGWSVDVLCRELAEFYAIALRGKEPLSQTAQLPIQYRDFAVWEKQSHQAAEQQRQLQYWTEQLTDSHPAELLCDKPRPAVPSGEAGVVETTIEGPLYRSLQRFCKTRQVTPFVVLLAAFRAAHYRLTGADDATIGTPIANRNRPEVEELVGFFVNTQCMRITVEDESFEGLVQQVRATATAAFANQDVPFERVVSALLPGSRDTSRNPLVQLMFAVHSQRHLGEIHLEGLAGEAVPGTASTRFDVEFHLFQGAERLNGSVLFASELFEPETLRGMVAVFQEVLRRGLDEPQTPVALLPLTDGLAELRDRGLLEIERTAYPRDSSIVDVFHEQVMACPDAPAVKDSSTQLTYAELDRQSDVLAAWLRRRRFAAETLIGVLAPRSCQTVVAFLGILKANLAYLPLDTNTPAGRIETILSSLAGHKLVLLGAEVQAPSIQLEDVEFDTIAETLDQQDLDKPERGETRPSATSLAYVIFTSGSTGRPKGVMVEHRGVVRLVKRSSSVFQLPRAPSIAQLMNITFDLSAWEMYAALLNGGTTVCIDHLTLLDGNSLRHTFEQENVSIAMMPAALIKQYLADSPSTIGVLNLLYSGADRLDGVDAKQARTLVAGGVYNAYGPTENAILSTIYGVSEQG